MSLIWRILKSMIATPYGRNMKKQSEEFEIWTSRTSQSSKYLQHGKVILESCLQLDLYFFAVIGALIGLQYAKTTTDLKHWKWTVIRKRTSWPINQTLLILPSFLSRDFTMKPFTFGCKDRPLSSARDLATGHLMTVHFGYRTLLINYDRPLWTFSNFKINTWFNSFWLETEKYMSFIFR